MLIIIIRQDKNIIGEDGIREVKNEKKKGSRFSETWIPVKSITDGCIILDDGKRVSGVKVTPRNIFILDQESQNAVINNLKDFYNQIDYEFWLIVADRPVDISVYMSQLQLLYNQSQSPAIRKLIMEDINKGNSFINNSVVDTEYYFLFKENNPEILQKKVRGLINGLSSCGLATSQTSNEDLRIILDNFLNGGQTSEYRTVVTL